MWNKKKSGAGFRGYPYMSVIRSVSEESFK